MPSAAWNPAHRTLPDHCEPVSPFLHFISSTLQICLPTPLALISSTLGVLSIISWLFAQLPQIYKNYKIKSTAGLSIIFIVEWLLADTANCIGAVLTNQAGWQITIAAYYVIVDLIMTYQHFWYTHMKQWQPNRLKYANIDDSEDSDTDFPPSDCDSFQQLRNSQHSSAPRSVNDLKAGRDQLPDEKAQPQASGGKRYVKSSPLGSSLTSPKAVLFVSMLCAVLANASSIPPTGLSRPHPAIPPPSNMKEFVGRIFSWISTILYLGSRLPQLYKNYTRKSTAGLSPLLFVAAFCGNMFYSSSLLTNPNGWHNFPPYGGGGWAGPKGNDRMSWIILAIPFWLGATGVLLLDVCVGIQFMKYGEQKQKIVTRVGRGRHRWIRVTGFMKGWIPSLSPERKASDNETQALISRESDRYGSV
ncbi:PQ-loop repeat-containing protein 2 [Nannizzia gypsea CBS 118893]|uniref:PQ-loop repeat-containing protein 2 n=1 Tax=Arthroderma gypseum (strain ATCC MYA-4604 / CBS 118893) TaxID=535722 RepID=E4UYQ1_ARTGP|nr:PQ-loop repeat-containing protein 2 [Nannizzia gypsea CBS 118893]EFR03231.1 PQ-loop repeat-containing protein 2 [Nannizzia gypsea CBS 118893]